ncbi:MAG: hypothetical protein RLZZ568_1199 [Cyanobacteriota bacterium]
MTRSLAKIREQLTQLDAQTETQWHRLAQTYDHYAQRLSQTLQQQAVYAVYQICTQIYPAAFLQLSVSNRQKFQQSIRRAITDYDDQFIAILKKQGITLDPSTPLPEPPSPTEAVNETLLLLESELDKLTATPKTDTFAPQASPSQDKSIETEEGSETDETGANNEAFSGMQAIKAFLSEALDQDDPSLKMLLPKMLRLEPDHSPIIVKTPDDLVQWHRQVEKGLQRSLVSLSMHLNHSLMEQKIIPQHLPPTVLEMALHAQDERLTPNRESMPHIVNLLIETTHQSQENHGDDEQADEAVEATDEAAEHLAGDTEDENGKDSDSVQGEISRLTAINLRLTDLEFSDVNLSMIRKQIRTHLSDLKKLRQEYRQLSQNKLRVEAELAWRNSWTVTETSDR